MAIVMTQEQYDRAHATLTRYRWREDDQPLLGIITDLFTDLQHLADAYNISTYDCWKKAMLNFQLSRAAMANELEQDNP